MPSHHDVILCHILVMKMSWKVQPCSFFCLYLIHSFVNMYEILRKLSSDTTYHKTRFESLLDSGLAWLLYKSVESWRANYCSSATERCLESYLEQKGISSQYRISISLRSMTEAVESNVKSKTTLQMTAYLGSEESLRKSTHDTFMACPLHIYSKICEGEAIGREKYKCDEKESQEWESERKDYKESRILKKRTKMVICMRRNW